MIKNITLKCEDKTYTFISRGGLADALQFFDIIEEEIDLFVEVRDVDKKEVR